jgi:hypothetical protein
MTWFVAYYAFNPSTLAAGTGEGVGQYNRSTSLFLITTVLGVLANRYGRKRL